MIRVWPPVVRASTALRMSSKGFRTTYVLAGVRKSLNQTAHLIRLVAFTLTLLQTDTNAAYVMMPVTRSGTGNVSEALLPVDAASEGYVLKLR
jgi:hypothetical protein